MAKVKGDGPETRAEAGTREKVCRKVVLSGLADIMFDPYAGDNETKLEPHQKLYFLRDQRTLCLPAANIMSFLSAQNTDSAPKRILDARKYKAFCFACAAYITINPGRIPFIRDGAPIIFEGFGRDEVCPSSGAYISRETARLPKGIPNPKVRPVLPLPWELHFDLTLWPNPDLQERQLLNVFEKGGISVALGTYRPVYGKFAVTHWE